MNELHWTRETPTTVRAWATALHADDVLPPYYLITKVGKLPVRTVDLMVGSPGHRQPQRVSVAKDLAEAKELARTHYNRERIAC